MSPEYSLHTAQNPTKRKDIFNLNSDINDNEDNTESTKLHEQLSNTLQMVVDSEEDPLVIPIIDTDA